MTVDAPAGVVRIAPAGDAALVLEFPPRIDPAINARAIAFAAAIERRCGAAVRDAVVGYCTVTVYFDPLLVDADWLEAEMRAVVAQIQDAAQPVTAVIDVPVCYGGDLGPDLAEVAAFGGCSPEDVVALHAGRTYRVYMVGFVPGWAYMAEVDPRIAAPRRQTPRTAVPPGAVAVAGGQTGVYPASTPGGWNLIGRTPLKPYDPARPDPFLFHAGDTVRFRPIDRSEYERAVGSA
jgi:KipI family sensor histidine kinase inhibitor